MVIFFYFWSYCRFRKLYSKNVRLLKIEGFLPQDLDVAENYKRYLKPLPQDFDVSDLKDDKILMELHLILVKRYLGLRVLIAKKKRCYYV